MFYFQSGESKAVKVMAFLAVCLKVLGFFPCFFINVIEKHFSLAAVHIPCIDNSNSYSSKSAFGFANNAISSTIGSDRMWEFIKMSFIFISLKTALGNFSNFALQQNNQCDPASMKICWSNCVTSRVYSQGVRPYIFMGCSYILYFMIF